MEYCIKCSGYKHPTALAGSMRECSCPKYLKEVYNIEPVSQPTFVLPKELEVTAGGETADKAEVSTDAEVPTNVEVSSGGSLRYNTGKPQFSHLSPDFIMEMANLMTKSAEKYSRQNWLRKQDIRTAADSLFRHYSAFMSGQDNDEGGSEMSHLLHIAVNAMIMWENYRMYGKEVDNRFYKTIKELMGEN